MKNKPLTCSFFVGGKQVEKLSSEQCERMAKSVGETLSMYYSAHPDEFAKLNLPVTQEG